MDRDRQGNVECNFRIRPAVIYQIYNVQTSRPNALCWAYVGLSEAAFLLFASPLGDGQSVQSVHLDVDEIQRVDLFFLTLFRFHKVCLLAGARVYR